MKRVALFCLLFSLWATPPLSAHPDLLAQIIQDLEQDPENIPLLIEKAQTLIQMEIFDEAEETLKLIDELQDKVSPESTYIHILLCFSKEDKEKAYEMSDSSIEAFPDHYSIWDIRGDMFNEDGKVSEAIEAYSKGLALNGQASPGYYLRLANLILERDAEADPEKALEVIHQGVTKIGLNSGLLQFRIRLNRDLENFDAALEDLDKLEEQFGFQMNFATDRAKIFTLAGRYEEGIEAYDQAIDHINADPENAQKKYMQRMMAKLQKDKAQLQLKVVEQE